MGSLADSYGTRLLSFPFTGIQYPREGFEAEFTPFGVDFSLFSGIGIIDAWFHQPTEIDDSRLSDYIAAEGIVKSCKSKASGDELVVDVFRLADRKGDIEELSDLKILLTTDGLSSRNGDIIVFPVRLEEIKDNPNFRPTGYADRMRRQGIIYRTSAGADMIKIKSFHTSIESSAAEWRDVIVAKVENSSLQRPTVDFIVALLFGDRSFLSEDVKDTFSNAGVAHVLALSGMHVAIIMGIVLFLLFPMKLIGLHRSRYFVALAILWAYAFFSGLAPSTVRACIMTSFVIIALCLQRRNASGNALLASAFVILLYNPNAIFDVGMQLSFLCVACILAFAGPLNTVNRHFHPLLHSLTSAILVSLVATMGSWILVSYYFKKIPLLFLPVNLVLLPLLPVYMSVALLYIALLLSGVDIHFLASVLDFGYELFLKLASWLSAFGESVISYQVQLPVVVLWLLGVLLFGYSIHYGRKKIAMAVSALFFAGAILLIPIMPNGEKDGIIIQRNYSEISVALYDAGVLNVERLPRNTVSRLLHKGNEILSVDCKVKLDSLAAEVIRNKRTRKKYLILGSGFRSDSLKNIPGLNHFDKIILHSSMKRKKESEILKEAATLGIEQLHSLREQGPLDIEL